MMQKSSSRLHQFYWALGAVLLISSSFVIPMSASSGPRSTVSEFYFMTTGQTSVPIPMSITTNFIDRILVQGLLENILGQGKIYIASSAAEVQPTGPLSNSLPAIAAVVAAENSGQSQTVAGQQFIFASTKTGLFGSSESASVAAAPAGAPNVYFTSGSQGGGIVKEAIRTDVELAGPGNLPEFLISSGNPNAVQIFYSSAGSSNLQSYSSTTSLSSVTSAIPSLWLDSSKRRSRSQIYVEILELMKRGPMTPFEIAFYARLNHKRTKEYAEFLRRSGYLEALEEDGRMTYVLSKNGIVFLEGIKNLFEKNQTTEYVNYDFQKN